MKNVTDIIVHLKTQQSNAKRLKNLVKDIKLETTVCLLSYKI